jgi:DNA-binding GntR family transcriptional regulator
MRLREKAYERFTRHLLALNIRPGQFISQRELVALTDMPLGAIREMIPRLEADGLITTVPKRGLQIANVDVKLVRNAFQLRTILEKEAVARFAERASDAEIEQLTGELERIERKAERGITPKLLEEAQAVDWGFHDTIIDALGNQLISSVYRVNSVKIRLIRLERVVLSNDAFMPAIHEHRAILDAIAKREPAAAAAAMGRHMVSARNRAMGIALVEEETRPAARPVRKREPETAK